MCVVLSTFTLLLQLLSNTDKINKSKTLLVINIDHKSYTEIIFIFSITNILIKILLIYKLKTHYSSRVAESTAVLNPCGCVVAGVAALLSSAVRALGDGSKMLL